MLITHPVLTCAESAAWEENLLGGDAAKTWAAIERAGEGVGKAALKDYLEIRPIPDDFRVLVLLGTGHNAADALMAARLILRTLPFAKVTALLLYPREKLRPLALHALDELEATGLERVNVRMWSDAFAQTLVNARFNLCIEGVLGMQMKPPLRAPAPEVFEAVSRMAIEMRAAVDLPAGLNWTRKKHLNAHHLRLNACFHFVLIGKLMVSGGRWVDYQRSAIANVGKVMDRRNGRMPSSSGL